MSIFNAIGGIIQGTMNQKSQRETNQANRELAEYGYSKDLEMWNKTNEYNDPTNQYNRMKGSGINPVAAFSKGSIQNTATQLPKYNTPTMQAPRMSGMDQIGQLSQFQDLKTKSLTNKSLQEDITSKATKNLWLAKMFDMDYGIKNQIGIQKSNENNFYKRNVQWRENQFRDQASIIRSQRQMWDNGINPNDSVYLRLINNFIEKNPKLGWAKDFLLNL